MDIIDILNDLDCNPKNKGSAHGGEHGSACPYCKDGKDRFVVWANKGNGGRFWCRVCNKKGDAIQLLRDHQGLTYKEACEALRIEILVRSSATPSLIAEDPPKGWVEKASAFVDWSHEKLLRDENLLSALKKRRGLTKETVERFKIGCNPEVFYRKSELWGLKEKKKIWLPRGLVIPTFEADKLVKVKIRNADYEKQLEKHEASKKLGEEPKYSPSKYAVVTGSKKCPSVYGNSELGTLLVLESELDAILMAQEVGDLCFFLALGGSSQPLDLHKERVVRGAEKVFFCPDFDFAGKESWEKWVKKFPDTERVLTPDGKDPTEALKLGIDLREWMRLSIEKSF